MIIVGDIACPTSLHADFLKKNLFLYSGVFKNHSLVCNFEGLLFDGDIIKNNQPVLYNHPAAIQTLLERGPLITGLANNHILDLPGQFDATIKAFKNNGIHFTGAGKSRKEAENPVTFMEDGKEIVLYNACWEFLLYNQKNPINGVYVAEIDEEKLITAVSRSKKEKPASAIVVFLHWNFDLETLPFPMHRQFARALIDAGANLVVGSHAHCVQGGEKYRDGYIVYGLGNFFMPHGVFAQGKVAYPKMAEMELVLEWNVKTNEATCHWFQYQHLGENHNLIHIGSEPFENAARLKEYSPFQGMNDKEYLAYFKKNRRKKILIPVFKDYRNRTLNKAYVLLLKTRARFARFLAKRNLINWQN